MKRTLCICLSLLLTGALLFSAVPALAVRLAAEDETDRVSAVPGLSGSEDSITIEPLEDETIALPILQGTSGTHVLYSWTASALEDDEKAFSSNLTGDDDEQLCWNESGVLYTKYAAQQMTIHNFRNKGNLKVDVYPMVKTAGMSAVGLSFVYAYKLSDNGLNPANSGLLRVYVSKDGETWSEDYVSVRSASILGSGTTQDGEEVIYYRIYTENLMNISSLFSENQIMMLRIVPDGESGVAAGSFSLCELTLTGYETADDFETAVPADFDPALDTDTCRTEVVNATKNSTATTELGRILDGISQVSQVKPGSIPEMLNTPGLRLMDGITNQATEDVEMLLEWMYEFDLMSMEYGEELLADYETITTTQDIIELNTPQQIFRGYAACEKGDILVQVTESASHAYMVTKCAFAYDSAGIYIDPDASTLTYLTLNGEQTVAFSELYLNESIVPMTLDVLADDAVQPVRADGHLSLADGVRVAVASNWDIESYELSMEGFTDTVSQSGTADIYTSAELDDAVAALSDGKHQMTVAVTNGLGSTETIVLEFEVKEEETVPEIQFALNGLNLRLQDLIKLGFYFNVETQASLDQIGALLWTAEEFAAETDFTVNSTKAYKAEAEEAGENRYMVETEGLYAQDLDTVYYIIPYAVTAGGDYVYGEAKSSSALVYANIAYNGGNVTEDTRSIVIDLLNYATRARTYFGYTEGLEQPDTLFNAILSEEDKALAWDESLNAAYPEVKELTGTYDPSINGLNTNLNEAIKLNFIFSDIAEGGGIGYWTEAEYSDLTEHTKANMPHFATISTSAAGNTVGSIEGLYSFDIYSNFYVMAFDAEGNCSRAYGASVASYLTTIISRNVANPDASEEDSAMVELAKAMLIYGDNARNNPDVNKGSN